MKSSTKLYSSYIVSKIMCLKFGNSGISMKELLIKFILYGSDQKKRFLGGVVSVQVQ